MSLFVQETGAPDAPVIVFLHGVGVSGWMWRPQIEQMTDFHCLIPDLPEHGRSHEAGNFSINNSVEHLAELIHSYVPDGRVHIVGLSLGAQIALQLMVTVPDMIDHVVLTGASIGPTAGSNLMTALNKLIAPLTKSGFIHHVTEHRAGIPEEYYEQFHHEQRRESADTLGRVTKEVVSFTMPPGLASIDLPLLVTVGQYEHQANIKSAVEIVASVPNAIGRIVPHAGHTWSAEAPDLFTRTLRAWITDEALPDELLPLSA